MPALFVIFGRVNTILLIKLLVLSSQQGSQNQGEDTDEEGKSSAYGHPLGVTRCIAQIEYIYT